ncbi:hypothetical protein BO71DRAFT_429952 [Aspergillus ellipticus CBS 707.79]|uniref:FAD/NAD(P)-binding domain-containing protein n=1 Tax=Aspergillus ellipticus CBS 707.79 TaxID=1448320 RepID=A0A319DAW2_9EURO|nr:hypothetical protein BO71DRAFT_429952 [Aspergillus ellipticus CBS 707.79]
MSHAQPPPPVDMVADAWTTHPTAHVLVGGAGNISMADIPNHIAKMHVLDLPRSERIRARVDEIIHDKTCKRSCFHDDYLAAFNRPNVKLVDTDGKGVQGVTATGVRANDEHFDLDVLIYATGFEVGAESPGSRSGISVVGRNGRTMDEKWAESPLTWHVIATHGCPDMFFSGPNQAGLSVTVLALLDTVAKHVAFIVSETFARQGRGKVTIEPTLDAESAWGMQVLAGAGAMAPLATCTPSYINGERSMDNLPMERQMKAASVGVWPKGMNDFMDVLQEWQNDGDFRELHVDTA